MSGKKSRNVTKKGRLVIISGPSGSGKTTICKQLTMNSRIKRSISYTTRNPRKGEKEGIDYHFIKRNEFEKLVDEGKLIEYEEYCGSLYGTPLGPIKETIKNGGTFILAVDVKGAMEIMRKISKVTSIFIMPPDDDTLRQRLKERLTDSEVNINTRLEIAKEELKYKEYYDYCVINDQLYDTVKKIKRILNLPDD
ncbi:MAG: guanylate kinase [Candidatus Scalinduaceae bacterium]